MTLFLLIQMQLDPYSSQYYRLLTQLENQHFIFFQPRFATALKFLRATFWEWF